MSIGQSLGEPPDLVEETNLGHSRCGTLAYELGISAYTGWLVEEPPTQKRLSFNMWTHYIYCGSPSTTEPLIILVLQGPSTRSSCQRPTPYGVNVKRLHPWAHIVWSDQANQRKHVQLFMVFMPATENNQIIYCTNTRIGCLLAKHRGSQRSVGKLLITCIHSEYAICNLHPAIQGLDFKILDSPERYYWQTNKVWSVSNVCEHLHHTLETIIKCLEARASYFV